MCLPLFTKKKRSSLMSGCDLEKHWECMKSYGVHIVLKTITALSETCGNPLCQAKMAWLKRSLNCGHIPLWYDSSEVSKVHRRLFQSQPINYSNTYCTWSSEDERGFSLNLCCQKRARITVNLLQLLLLLRFQFTLNNMENSCHTVSYK